MEGMGKGLKMELVMVNCKGAYILV